MSRPIAPELHREIAAIAESVGCELWHVQFEGNRLQVFLDKPVDEAFAAGNDQDANGDPGSGVTIDDCQTVSRQLSALLDVEDWGDRRYILEVGSPGLDRQLFRLADYARYTGSLARVTFTDVQGRKKTVVGRLGPTDAAGSGGGTVHLTVEAQGISKRSETVSESYEIPFADIRVARLEVEL